MASTKGGNWDVHLALSMVRWTETHLALSMVRWTETHLDPKKAPQRELDTQYPVLEPLILLF